MENAETILVIILSTFLAIFLILAIILTVKAIKIARRVSRIVDTAEGIVDKAEHAAATLSKAAAPAMIGKFLTSIADIVGGRNAKKKKR